MHRAHLLNAALLLPFILLLAACPIPQIDVPDFGPGPAQMDMTPQRSPLAVLALSDFNSGALGTVDLTTRATQKALDTIDAQSVVRVFGGKVYVLDQTHGLVRVYDPASMWKNPVEFPTSHQNVPAADANPHDIYVDTAAQKAYVTIYGALNATIDGDHALGVIDLKDPKAGIKSFISLKVNASDTDGNPDADRLFSCGGALFVVLQDVDRNLMYRPAAPARLGIVKLAQPDTADYLQLAGQNPSAVAQIGTDCSKVLIAHADFQLGGMPMGKGGIERVDLSPAARKSLGLVMTDTQLGGNISAMDAADLTRVYVDVLTKSGMDFAHNVYVVDIMAKMKGAKVLGPLPFIPAIRVYGGQVLVLSAGYMAMPGKNGLYLGKDDGQPMPATPIDLGLAPISVDIY